MWFNVTKIDILSKLFSICIESPCKQVILEAEYGRSYNIEY